MNGMNTDIDPPVTSAPARAILLLSLGLLVVGFALRLLSVGEAVVRGSVRLVAGAGRTVRAGLGSAAAGIRRGVRTVNRHRTAAACVAAAPIVGGLAVTAYAAIG